MTLHGHVHPEKQGENYDGDYDCTDCGQQCGGTFQCSCCGRIVGWCQGGDMLGPSDDVCSDCISKMCLPLAFDYAAGDRVEFGWTVTWNPSGFAWEAGESSVSDSLCWHLRKDSKRIGVVQHSIFGDHFISGMIGGPGSIGTITDCASALIALARESGSKS